MSDLVIGDFAPDFTLLNQKNEPVELRSFRGQSNVVVYFYPKASTPGCTVQACGIRDLSHDFTAYNTVVLGVSPDAVNRLQKFDHKYDLGFTILSDEDHKVADAYGVWGLKKFMGKEFLGILRTSFIIDIDGRLRQVLEKVNTKTHASTVLDYVKHNL